MGLAKSADINPALRALLDKALLAPNGLQVEMTTPEAAKAARFGMYHLRDQERKNSRKIYDRNDPLYDKSPWETLSLSIVDTGRGDGSVYLRIMEGSLVLEGLKITDPITGEPL